MFSFSDLASVRSISTGGVMAVTYSVEVVAKLRQDLLDCLADAGVQEAVAKWLADHNIVKLTAFADLADSKNEIIDVVGRPAGLDPADSVACQPLKTAWRQAEATTKAVLEAKAKGEDPDKDFTLSPEQRERLDDQVLKHYNFSWPPSMISHGTLIGRLRRFYSKRTDYVPRLETDVRNILEKEADPKFKLFISKQGQVEAQSVDEYTSVQGLWTLKERHLQLMIAYNHAAAPEFKNAHLTTLLDYHQWMMSKAFDLQGASLPVSYLVKADLNMRTRWMLSWKQKQFPTLTEVIEHHRGQSAYLFADMPAAGDEKTGKRKRAPAESGDAAGSASGAAPWTGLERTNKKGERRCPFYNKTTGCRKGKDCPDVHECDFPHCNRKHSRAEHHATKPPSE